MAKFYNREQAIARLMEKLGLKTQKELLRELYKIYFYRTGEGAESWVKKKESNFSSAKKGDRDFTLEEKFALSELSGLSFTELCRGENYTPFSIHYAVYRDEESLYERLAETVGCDGDALTYQKDEFGKWVLDYILEYKRERGLRFMLDNEYMKYYLQDGHYRDPIAAWIVELDDVGLFEKFVQKAYGHGQRKSTLEDDIADAVLDSKNIIGFFETVCEVSGTVKGALREDFMLLMLRAVSTKRYEVADRLFAFYERYVGEQVQDFVQKHGTAHSAECWRNGTSLKYIDIIANDADERILLFDFDSWRDGETVELFKQIYRERLSAISADAVCDRISGKPTEISEGDEYISAADNKMYRKCPRDLGYDMMELMTESEVYRIPRFFGVDEQGALVSDAEWEDHTVCADHYGCIFDTVVEVLSDVHRVSEQRLGHGRVYAYKDCGDAMFCGIGKRRVFALGGWIDNTRITTPEQALVCATLAFADIVNCKKSARSIYESIRRAFESYYNRSHLVDFGDNLVAEIRKAKATINKKSDREKYLSYAHAEAFAEAYLDELNALGERDV